MCTDVTMSHCCLLSYDLSLSVQGHLISLKYLQQASGPDHHFIPYSPSIYSSQQPSLSPSVVKVKSNWILPSPVFPSRLCLCVCVCSLIHHHINKNLHLYVCFVSVTVHEPVTLSISLCVCERELNLFAHSRVFKCRRVSCVRYCKCVSVCMCVASEWCPTCVNPSWCGSLSLKISRSQRNSYVRVWGPIEELTYTSIWTLTTA